MEAESLWIRLSDGTRLSASLFRPPSPPPWPVVLEARPYRKDDCTAGDRLWYERFAQEGDLAAVRVDLRGTGSSEGIASDEYPAQEQADLVEVIAWLAGQSWSTGRVGMFGKSYSGFNALQVAMERPPQLAAIVAIYATDDRYTDDVHYGGGARRGLDLLDYPTYMVAMNALPPVPALSGPDWRERWAERVLRTEPWLLRWFAEPTDGPYWRHGSLRTDYARIRCATMIVGGWADAYRNATLRVFERLEGPRRLLIGPWSHMRPEASVPGPRVDVVPDLIRWWDRWLRGRDTGVDREPPITVYVRRPSPPEREPDVWPGSWRFERAWPPDRAERRTMRGADAVVRQAATMLMGPMAPDGADELTVRGDAGTQAPSPGADAPPWGVAEDQTAEEAAALVYEWTLGDAAVDLLGYPVLELEVRSSVPVGQLAARLCCVLPKGGSVLVTRGVLNLTHRASHRDPEPMPSDRCVPVRIELDATAFCFEPGHRLRLLLLGADWPSVWPPPQPSVLGIVRESLRLHLPVVTAPPPDAPRPGFPDPSPATTAAVRASQALPATWRCERDVVEGETRFTVERGDAAQLASGIRVVERTQGTIAVSAMEPARAWAEAEAQFELAFPEATVATSSHVRLETDVEREALTIELVVREDDVERWRRRWQRVIPRRLR